MRARSHSSTRGDRTRCLARQVNSHTLRILSHGNSPILPRSPTPFLLCLAGSYVSPGVLLLILLLNSIRQTETIKHHPAALNVELLGVLLRQSKEKTLLKFLSKDLSCVNAPLAARLLAEARLPQETAPAEMPDKMVVALAQLLSEAHFPAPPSSCLSPVGEYNMRLGILKELRPELVATYQDTACTVEGHPMIVEAGVCLGGPDAKPGISVYRFANRIPLLFEGGGDVATQVSKRRINWGAYKIRQNQDKIGVFISVVSTKVPFKGTGKEYIGDDIPEVHAAVKRAMERCCLQLKVKLVKQRAMADERERKKNMTKCETRARAHTHTDTRAHTHTDMHMHT